jgi:hypothetical protein
MHPEVQELQSKLKEILYDCAVEIRATKAALYLLGAQGRFELVTEYGFRNAVRPSADRTDPVIDRCGRGRTPFFVNGLNADPRFSLVMFESASDRLMAAPIYLRGHLVGVIDMRDKQGKLLFDANDLPKAQKIADRIGEQFRKKNVFGQHFITLSEAPEKAVVLGVSVPITDPGPDAAPVRPATTVQSKASFWPVERQPASHVPRLPSLILEARSNAEQIAIQETPPSMDESDLATIREMLRALLLLPGAVVAMVSAYGHLGGVQEVAARSTLTDDALNILQSKLNLWLTKRGERGGPLRTNVMLPLGTEDAPIREQQINKVFTAPVAAASLRGIYLTVVFIAAPERLAHELLSVFHRQLQIAIESSISRRAIQEIRSRVAAALLEPDFSKYPELRRHSEAVAARVEAFSRFVRLSPAEAENARIVALIHDVGMRLLDYDNLYRRDNLSPDELAILREHPAVSAAIVEPLLGHEIARAVLTHHERWDGLGYPNNLMGTAIPLVARVVQICDVYETMTASDSYAATETLDQAATKMAQGAGTQFDPDLTQRFLDMLSARLA